MQIWNRRNFLEDRGSGFGGIAGDLPRQCLEQRVHTLVTQGEPARPVAANDHIQIALIGAGGQGMGDTRRRCRCRA